MLLFLLCHIKRIPVKQKGELVFETVLTSLFTTFSLSSSFAEGFLANDCCKGGSPSKPQTVVLGTRYISFPMYV